MILRAAQRYLGFVDSETDPNIYKSTWLNKIQAARIPGKSTLVKHITQITKLCNSPRGQTCLHQNKLNLH